MAESTCLSLLRLKPCRCSADARNSSEWWKVWRASATRRPIAALPRTFVVAFLLMALATPAFAETPKSAPAESVPAAKESKERRRVFVLHSGVHTILSESLKNGAAEALKCGLQKRGIAENDLIVLDNPFPTASWKNLFPYESLTLFMDLADPSSQASHDAYKRMYRVVKDRGVGPKDEVVWVGHSAGGQVGMTMAHLSRDLWRFPELARDAGTLSFGMVITLGAPVGANHLPEDVKLRVYYSPRDRVVRWAPKVSPLVLYPLGYKSRLSRIPMDLCGDFKIRCFDEIEHPSWDLDDRVLDRILGEIDHGFRPRWQSQLCTPRPGLSLSQFLCRVVEEQLNVSLEDPPRP